MKNKSDIIHLVWHYPVVCQTPKEDFFKICKDAGGGEIVSTKGKSTTGIIRKIWRKSVHAQGRGFPFPEAACLFAKKSIYSPHNDTLGSRWYTRAARRFLYNRYDVILSETEYGRKMLEKQGIKKEKIKTLPIPVDYNFFSKPRWGSEFRKKHKLGSGTLALVVGIRPVKNPDIILEACRIAGINAVMVGPHKRKDVDSVWKGVDFGWYLPDERLLSHPNAVFVGQLGADELRSAMDAASVFINSSDFESFGLAVYEAAAAGLPLCLPRYGPVSAGMSSVGTFDAFRGCALFHSNHDIGGLAENIKKYMKYPKLKKQNAERAEKVAKRFDYPVVRKQYEELYTEVFGKRK